MALTADYTGVRDWNTIRGNEAVTRDTLALMTMAVGMYEITEANARDFYARVSFWEKVNGAQRYDDGTPVYLTPEDILRFIGLRTNASPMTEAKYRNHVWNTHKRFNVPHSL